MDLQAYELRTKKPWLFRKQPKKPGFGGNESAGARTQDPRIKRQNEKRLKIAVFLGDLLLYCLKPHLQMLAHKRMNCKGSLYYRVSKSVVVCSKVHLFVPKPLHLSANKKSPPFLTGPGCENAASLRIAFHRL